MSVDAVSSRHPRVRAAAIDLLASFPKDRRVLRALRAAFADDAWVVRMQAAETAVRVGKQNQAILRVLRRLLDDPHELVRIEALSSLAVLKDSGARRRMYALLGGGIDRIGEPSLL